MRWLINKQYIIIRNFGVLALLLMLIIPLMMVNQGMYLPDNGVGTMGKAMTQEGRIFSPNVFSIANKIAGVAGQITRGPILIIGDAAFTSANGVSDGTGTEQDPYIIANFSINGNDVDNCIRIRDTTKHFIIENCILIKSTTINDASIFLSFVSNGHLRNNTCISSYFGIRMYGCSSMILTNNICSGNGNDGIDVHSGSLNTIINNTCNSNSENGIAFTLNSSNTIVNNTCNSNDYSGIRIEQSSSNILTTNICNENGYYGIKVQQGSSNILNKNFCSGNGFAGIIIDSSGSLSNTVTNNFCNGSDDGIFVSSCSSNTLSNNNCSGNDYGIRLYYCSSNTLITNILSNNVNYGIYLEYFSTSNVIHSNWIWDNGDNNITGTLVDNYIYENFFYLLGKYDVDHDGLTDEQEIAIGTNPILVDTDGDNFMDGYEYAYGSDPLDSNNYPLLWKEDFDMLLMYLDGNTTLLDRVITWSEGNATLIDTIIVQLESNATIIQQVLGWLDDNATAIEQLFTYLGGNASQLALVVTHLDGNATLLETVHAIASGNVVYLQTLNASCITQFEDVVAIIDQLGISVGDTDCDGLSDLEEVSYGTSIVLIDTDCDNLNDAFEIKIGTDPLDDDSDGDGYLDGIEILLGTKPNDALDFPGSTPSSTSTTTTTSTTTPTTSTTPTTTSTTTKTTPAIDWVMAIFLLTTISIVLAFKKK